MLFFSPIQPTKIQNINRQEENTIKVPVVGTTSTIGSKVVEAPAETHAFKAFVGN